VKSPDKYNFASAPKSMKQNQLLIWQNSGMEVACHGATHLNTADDVLRNIEELKSFKINVESIGFASPESWLTGSNIKATGIDLLKQKGIISYVRTGIQVRREGFVYTFISAIDQLIHSKHLYYYLNKKNIINVSDIPDLLPSVAVKDFTTFKQIKYFINKLDDNQTVILMFHSILPESNQSYGADHYYWSSDRFNKLCNWLSINKDVLVTTTYDFLFRLG